MKTSNSASYVQDKNAGNSGDLLKHFWLLKLIDSIVSKLKPNKVAYLESHAGAGYFVLDKKKVRQLYRDREKMDEVVGLNSQSWQRFNRFNADVEKGVYLGSWPLALRCFSEHMNQNSNFQIKVHLWECDSKAKERIRENLDYLVPKILLKDVQFYETFSKPEVFIRVVKGYADRGFKVVWLCDPYWGQPSSKSKPGKDVDGMWWNLLEHLQGTYGIVFAFIGGNSNKEGIDKFDFKSIQAPCLRPERKFWICNGGQDGVRAYGLFLTDAVKKLLEY